VVKWAKRKPAAAGLCGVLLVAVLAAGAVWAWLVEQAAERRAESASRAERTRAAVETTLEQVKGLQRQARWAEAEAALVLALSRLGEAGPADLQQRLQQARNNLRFMERLDIIRLDKLDKEVLLDEKKDPWRAGPAYAVAFKEHGLDMLAGPELDLVWRIAASPVKEQLVAILEDWAGEAKDDQTRARLLTLARRADPNIVRNQFRHPHVWRDRRQLAQLTAKGDVEHLSPALLVILGRVLEEMGGPGVELLEQGQRRYPGEFWLNFELAHALNGKKRGQWDKAIGYYRAALALRPQTGGVYNGLGLALYRKQDLDGAIAACKKAIEINPKHGPYHMCLGLPLLAKGDLNGAIAAYKQAIALAPKYSPAHTGLGNALLDQGDVAAAIAAHRRAIALDPKYAAAHTNLGVALHFKGDLAGAIAAHKQAIALDPKYAVAHVGLGNALKAKGELDQAIAAYRKAIALDPKLAPAHRNLGNALAAKQDLDGAVTAFKIAIAIDPKYAEAHLRLGLALLRQERFAEARPALQKSLDLLPPGSPFRKAVSHQLRNCEHFLLEAKFAAILKGDARPANAAEQLALAKLCQYPKELHAAAAHFYADAFAANPKLADDLDGKHRYNAACVAALAAAGEGEDAAKLGDKERARWRKQALAWLQADLTAWTRLAKKGPAKTRATVERTLRQWQKDLDLTGLRDSAALAKLPEEEQKAWRKLWAEVAAVLKKAQEKAP
jgi:tetratricopeptide (TPR) repeat protein